MMERKLTWMAAVINEGFTSLASLIVILLLLIAVLDGCFDGSNNSVDATPDGEISGSVVYSGDLDIAGTQELFYSTLNGDEQRKISGYMLVEGGLSEFKLSPDYRYAAYRVSEYQESIHEFYVTRISDGKVVKVSPPYSEGEHFSFRDTWGWSPDSKYLKFTTQTAYEDNGDITVVNTLYIVSRDGVLKAKIAGLADYVSMWSPSSSHLYYISNTDTYSSQIELHLIGPGTTDNAQFIDTAVMTGQVNSVQWSPDGGWLAYLGMDLQYKLFTVKPDGSENTKVDSTVTEGSHVTGYKWSPDGSYLAYRAYAQGITNQYELYTVRPDGSNDTKVSGTLDADEHVNVLAGRENPVKWSPDGSRLVYTVLKGPYQTNDIYSVFADGSENHKLNHQINTGEIIVCEWSPDGSHLTYMAANYVDDGFFNLELSLAAADGSLSLTYDAYDRYRFSVYSPRCTFSGTWSPDSAVLLHNYSQEPYYAPNHALVIAADGSGNIPLSFDDYRNISDWRWSPNGQYLSAWGSQSEGPDELFTIKPDGSQFTSVSNPLEDEKLYRYQWSPDGAYLAYGVRIVVPDQQWEYFELYSVLPDGKNKTLLNEQSLTGYFGYDSPLFEWYPNTGSQQLVYCARPYPSTESALFSVYPDGLGHTSLNGVPVEGSTGVKCDFDVIFDFVVFDTPAVTIQLITEESA